MAVKELTLFGRVTDGRVIYPAKMTQYILSMNVERFKITIRNDRPKRSTAQNSYWWGIIIPHVVVGLRETGVGWMDPNSKEHREIAHEMLLRKFLNNGEVLRLADGTEFIGRSSSTRLTTEEMTQLIETVRNWALEFLGMHIPTPDELS